MTQQLIDTPKQSAQQPPHGYLYALSEDAEQWAWADTEGEAHGEAQSQIDDDSDKGDEHCYFIGTAAHPLDMIGDKCALWIGERVLEDLECQCADEIGSDDAILELTSEQLSELGNIVLAYIRENAHVNTWGVKDPQKHTYIAGSVE